MHAAATRGKAIFIDGPSANKTKQALGIRDVNFSALFKILLLEVGKCRRLTFPPVVTVHPERLVAGHGLDKHLAGAGFEVVPVVSTDSADDDYLKSRILKLSSDDVCEIVLFSSDKDFVPVLRAKATQGIAIVLVSTMRLDARDNHCSVSQDVQDLVDSGEFDFFDLAPHVSRIKLVRNNPNTPAPCCRQADNVTKITLRLKSENRRDHLNLVNALQRLKADFPNLSCTIDE